MQRMRTVFVVIFTSLLFLVGCNQETVDSQKDDDTKTIVKEAVEKGEVALKDEDLTEAKKQFSLAAEQGESSEAKAYLKLIDKAEDLVSVIEDEDFDEAIELYNKITEHENYKAIQFFLKDKNYEEKLNKIINKREEIDKKIYALKELYDPSDKDMVPSELYLVRAEEILEEKYISKKQKKKVRKFLELAGERVEEVMNEMEKEQIQAEREVEKREKRRHSPSSDLSPEEAREILYHYLIENNIATADQLNDPDLYLDFDHETEEGEYMFQLYNIIVHEDGMGHTATWGWYTVNPMTGEVDEAF